MRVFIERPKPPEGTVLPVDSKGFWVSLTEDMKAIRFTINLADRMDPIVRVTPELAYEMASRLDMNSGIAEEKGGLAKFVFHIGEGMTPTVMVTAFAGRIMAYLLRQGARQAQGLLTKDDVVTEDGYWYESPVDH